MSNPELLLLSTRQETPVEPTRLVALNDALEGLTDEVAEKAALEEVFASATAAEFDPARKEQLEATADILRWTYWGKVGDPLPQALEIVVEQTTIPDFKAAFPLSTHDYEQSINTFIRHGFLEAAFPNKPARAHDYTDIVDERLAEMETDSRSIAFLKGLASTQLADTLVYDPLQDQTRQAAAREQVKRQYGQDIYERNLSDDLGNWMNARQAYGRMMFYDDPPQKTVQVPTYSVEESAKKLQTFLNGINPNAEAVVSRAYNSYDLPDYLNNPKSHEAQRAYLELVVEAQKTLDGPLPFPAVAQTFLQIANTLLMKGRDKVYDLGSISSAEIALSSTWEQFIDSTLGKRQERTRAHYGDMLSGLDAHHQISRATLLALRQPTLPTRKRPDLTLAPVPPAGKARLENTDYSPQNKMTDVLYLSKEYQEQLDATPVATVLELTTPTWPQVRRLVQGRPRYKDSVLPKSVADADLGLFISQPDLLEPDQQPHIIGFTLVAEDVTKKQYFFKYAPERDPYSTDRTYAAHELPGIIDATRSIGMFELADAIKHTKDLSVRGLARLIQDYSYHGYPDDSLVAPDQKLLANAETLQDLQKFVTPEGFYCTQCSGGARMFQLLAESARYYSRSTKAIQGLVWDGGSTMITAAYHRQVEFDSMVVDVSLLPKSKKKFPLRTSNNPNAIPLGLSSEELGIGREEAYAGGLAVEQRERATRGLLRRLMRNTLETPSQASGLYVPELVTPGYSFPTSSNATTEILESHKRPLTSVDYKLASIAERRLEEITSQDIEVALSLGEQALYGAHIDVLSAVGRVELRRQTTQAASSENALETLQRTLPDRKKQGGQHQRLLYGRKAIETLRAQAEAGNEHDEAVIRQAAYILDLLGAADI